MKYGYIYGGKVKGSLNLGTDPYSGLPSTIFAPGGLRGPTLYGGTVYYVDLNNGDDSNNGLTPDEPFLSLQYAIDQCTNNNDDTIVILPGSLDISGDANYLQDAGSRYGALHYIIVDKSGIHILGPNLWNPNEPEQTAIYRSDAEQAPLFYVTGANVEIAYFAMSCNWAGDNPLTSTYAGLDSGAVMVLDGEAGSRNYAWVHHMRFPMWWSTVGITMWGTSANVIEDCIFENLSNAGVTAGPTPSRNCTFNTIRNNRFTGCDYAYYGLIGGTERNFIIANNIMKDSSDNQMVRAVYFGLTGVARRFTVCHNTIDMALAQAFADSGGAYANQAAVIAGATSVCIYNYCNDGLAF